MYYNLDLESEYCPISRCVNCQEYKDGIYQILQAPHITSLQATAQRFLRQLKLNFYRRGKIYYLKNELLFYFKLFRPSKYLNLLSPHILNCATYCINCIFTRDGNPARKSADSDSGFANYLCRISGVDRIFGRSPDIRPDNRIFRQITNPFV